MSLSERRSQKGSERRLSSSQSLQHRDLIDRSATAHDGVAQLCYVVLAGVQVTTEL